MMADRLKLNDAERFSSDERVLINDALKVAMDRQVDLQIPPAIRELDINRMDKRILPLRLMISWIVQPLRNSTNPLSKRMKVAIRS